MGDLELDDHLDFAVGALRHGSREPAQEGAGSALDVQGVGLTVHAPELPIRASGLDHLAQDRGRRDAVGAGALDSEHRDCAERGCPDRQLLESTGAGGYRRPCQCPSDRAHHRRDVHLLVRRRQPRRARNQTARWHARGCFHSPTWGSRCRRPDGQGCRGSTLASRLRAPTGSRPSGGSACRAPGRWSTGQRQRSHRVSHEQESDRFRLGYSVLAEPGTRRLAAVVGSDLPMLRRAP